MGEEQAGSGLDRHTGALVAVAALMGALSTVLGINVHGWRLTAAVMVAAVAVALVLIAGASVVVSAVTRFRLRLVVTYDSADSAASIVVLNAGRTAEFRADGAGLNRVPALPAPVSPQFWSMEWVDPDASKKSVVIPHDTHERVQVGFFRPENDYFILRLVQGPIIRFDQQDGRSSPPDGAGCDFRLRVARLNPERTRNYLIQLRVTGSLTLAGTVTPISRRQARARGWKP